MGSAPAAAAGGTVQASARRGRSRSASKGAAIFAVTTTLYRGVMPAESSTRRC